jgi:hypothetical protein
MTKMLIMFLFHFTCITTWFDGELGSLACGKSQSIERKKLYAFAFKSYYDLRYTKHGVFFLFFAGKVMKVFSFGSEIAIKLIKS